MSKRIFALTIALALSIVAPFAVAAETAAAKDNSKAPKLLVVTPIKDFGTVPKGEKLDWAFEIRNTGASDLEIIAARPSCGCTVADFDKVIKAGQTGKVSAHVDTTNFAGPIAKTITIESNDPATPNAQVTITAVVKPFVEAYPAGFVRFNMLQGDIDKQSVTLYSEETDPFEIVKVESPQDWIHVDAKKLDAKDNLPNVGRAGANQYKLDITVGGPDSRVGPLAEKVHVITTSKHQPDYYISVSGVVRPTFRVEPSGVNFGEVAPTDAAATRSVIVRSNDLKTPENFVVTKAESGVPGVTAEVKPTANKGEYEVTLQVGKDAKGPLDGNVTIYTNDKTKPMVVVPLKGTVKTATASASNSK
ncbi:MAG: DUF1573 domain-containing protein [Acidobacteria bacterium]|nr:DUF1573 domain-containing protein [Acidobacteriota bacterium]MBV9476012.1 DUF1573 domain-containing protein [Acidobacteriota bacterium]